MATDNETRGRRHDLTRRMSDQYVLDCDANDRGYELPAKEWRAWNTSARGERYYAALGSPNINVNQNVLRRRLRSRKVSRAKW